MSSDLSIKWKILGIAIAGPLLISIIMAFQRVGDIKSSAIASIEEKSRAVILMAEAARNEMAKKLDQGVMRPFDQIPKQNLVEAVPVITAINMAQENAAKMGFTIRVPKESPRNPKNQPDDLERAVLRELETSGLAEKIIVDDDNIHYFRPIRLTKDCMLCHGDPKGSQDPVGGIREGWKVGDVRGAFHLIASLKASQQKAAMAQLSVAAWALGILAAVFLTAWWLLKQGVMRPLHAIENYAGAVAKGDLSAHPQGSFSGELARMKVAIETMVGNLKEKMAESEQKKEEARRATLQAEAALKESLESQAQIQELFGRMKRVADDALNIAHQVSSASEELSAQVDEVNKGADIQSQRTGETATAMEEMNATVLEVARNSTGAAESADNARTEAMKGESIVERSVAAIQRVYQQSQELKSQMTALGQQAEGISRILDVISDIADQTNLLALNAAIEAARAGDAGRGFAVVADEVRKLAEKTMGATKEVGDAIASIQQGARSNTQTVEQSSKAIEEATSLASDSGRALQQIVEFATQTSDKVRSIATAAEQQSATSEEINRAVEDVSRISNETSQGMIESAKAVADLARLAAELQGLIEELTSGETRSAKPLAAKGRLALK